MSTIHNINGDLSAGTAVLQPTDVVPVYVAADGVSKKLTGAQIMGGTGGVVAVTAGATTLTVTQASHAGRTIVLNNTAPITITLPQATGSGSKYKFFFAVAATGTTSGIKVANATDVMTGVAWMLTTSTDNAIGFKTSATSDTIAANGTTLGGVVGDTYEIEDVATGVFSVVANLRPTGTYATPFSATV